MSIGWETNEKTQPNRVKVDITGEINEFNFWEGVTAVGSEISSEFPFTVRPPEGILTFKVASVSKTARFDRITGFNDELVYIYGDWRESTPKIGNVVSVVPCFCCPVGIDFDDLNIVTNESNYLIIHSDRSLTTTTVIESLDCLRKALLLGKVAFFNRKVTKKLLYGLIIHEWLDYLVRERDSTVNEAAKYLKKILKNFYFYIFQVNGSEDIIFQEIFKYFIDLKGFVKSLEFTESLESLTVYSRIFQIKGKPDVVVMKDGKNLQIELKTGDRLTMENIAQVILYGLLQKERFSEVSQKIFHLKNNRTLDVKLGHLEVVRILVRKNGMVRKKGIPPRKIIPQCDGCFMKETCENFSKVEGSIRDVKKDRKDFMADLLKVRLRDEGVLGFILEEIDREEELSKEPILSATVERWDKNILKIFINEKKSKNFSSGEYISVYDENMCMFSRGVVSTVDNQVVEIQMFEKIQYDHRGSIFVSKDFSEKGFSEMRSSLLHLSTSEEVKDKWIIRPKTVSGVVPRKFAQEYSELNRNQQLALINSLEPSPYSLIHGMPGTGKTRIISLLTRIWVSQGKRVLITCFTHLALTNLERRLETDENVKIYRTGSTMKKFSGKPENIGVFLDSFNVVLSTSRAVYTDPIFTREEFDVLISDEATQQNFLMSVIPCMISKSFVLVGDHLQLSPLAKTETLSISLFDLLRRKTEKINALTVQYRMSPSIMEVSNRMFYEGQMEAHTKEPGRVVFIDILSGKIAEFFKNLKKSVQILCYFNEQVRNVREMGREAETVDRFQGSEEEEVVLLLDVLLEGSPKIEILTSKERLNVGVTRAKRSLTILGNEVFLKSFPIFQELFKNVSVEKYKE